MDTSEHNQSVILTALQELSSTPDPSLLQLLLEPDATYTDTNRPFFDVILGMNDREFREHFRLTRDITMKLIEDLALPINSGSTLSKEERCYIGLWYLANNCPYRLLAEQFSISKSTAHEVVTEFMQSIICKLRTQSSLPTIADTGPCTLPGCVGYVDGSHIYLVKRPSSEPDLYYNRKQDFTINIMIVCDNKLRVVYYYIGAFGSAHDKRVFRCSSLPEMLSNAEPGLFILGDSAYPLTERLLIPYSKPSSPAEHKFNKLHKSLRVKVENCLGLLKCQWRRLKYLDANSIERGNMIIESCILLHNYGINHGLDLPEFDEADDATSHQLRLVDTDTTPAGHAKRDAIAAAL